MLTAPSTRPSMCSDSDPVTSPLITMLLPIIADAWVPEAAIRAIGSGAMGEMLARGRSFSGAGADGLSAVVEGFHMGATLLCLVWLGPLTLFLCARASPD